MLPNKTDLDESVEQNFNEIFKGIKVSKKAEKKIKELIVTNIAFGFKLRNTAKLHNDLVKLSSTSTKVLNEAAKVYNHYVV
jgi:DNA polymerase III delta prime subunit